MQQYLHLPIPLSSHPKINTTNQLLKVNFKLFGKSETFIEFNTFIFIFMWSMASIFLIKSVMSLTQDLSFFTSGCK